MGNLFHSVNPLQKMKHCNFSIDDICNYASKKVSIEGWLWYKWEVLDRDSFLVTGEVPFGVYTKGKNKGKHRFGHPKSTNNCRVVVIKSELEAEALSYEQGGKKCWDCKGSGKVWRGWSKDSGTRFSTCPRCHGVGTPRPES